MSFSGLFLLLNVNLRNKWHDSGCKQCPKLEIFTTGQLVCRRVIFRWISSHIRDDE